MIKAYIDSKKNQWSKTTLKSEASRLHANRLLLDRLPEEACLQLGRRMSAYAVKTTMIRLSDYKAFIGDHSWRTFLRDNSKLFQNAYVKERLDITFEEAKDKIALLSPDVRDIATELLISGARISELLSHKQGRVIGKGGRVRDLFMKCPSKTFDQFSYNEVYHEFKKVGLKPHTLRKLAATRMVEMGFNEMDLMRVMGWSQIATAACYLQPKRDEEIRRRLLEAK